MAVAVASSIPHNAAIPVKNKLRAVTEIEGRDEYYQFIRDGVVAIEIFANWFDLSQGLLHLHFEELSNEPSLAAAKFGMLYWDNHYEIIDQDIGIDVLPAVVFLKDGNVVDRIIGWSEEEPEEIYEKIKGLLSKYYQNLR